MVLQRIQSVYLLLAAICTAVFGYLTCCPSGWGLTEIIGIILSALLTVLALIAIFSYRNLSFQASQCSIGALLSFTLAACFCLGVYPQWEAMWKASLPFVAMLLWLMARKGIKHDAKLLRDSDRIR